MTLPNGCEILILETECPKDLAKDKRWRLRLTDMSSRIQFMGLGVRRSVS